MPFTGIAIGLAVFNALWLVARRVRTFFAERRRAPESELGWRGLVILPMRIAAEVASKACGFGVLVLFVTDAQIDSFNIAVAALLVGFVAAYGINYVISRWEQKPGEHHGTSH